VASLRATLNYSRETGNGRPVEPVRSAMALLHLKAAIDPWRAVTVREPDAPQPASRVVRAVGSQQPAPHLGNGRRLDAVLNGK
jgi:hypothetical protein